MIAAAYRQGQRRVLGVASAAPAPNPRVPACPAWSVTDLVRHLTGVAADIVAGNLDGWATDEWTNAQVVFRANASLDDLAGEWDRLLEPISVIFDDPEQWDAPAYVQSLMGPLPTKYIGLTAVSDLIQHEFDLRNALSVEGDRADPVVHLVAEGYVRSLRPVFAARELPTLRVESTDFGRGWNIGRDEPSASLGATSFELMRSIAGRRTIDEVAALDWEGDAAAFIPYLLFPANSSADVSLGERR